MRIEAYNQISQVYKTSKTGKAYASSNTTSARDEVQISSFGQAFQVAKDAVKNASDIREDKVASVKSAIDNGSYSVSTDDFASKLLEKYNESLI
ncbi:MAG: flagellar biosynthesis anti-sigma factor FlgM [Eubacterium sp.]|nr:flagellar biosynthesis anti-sigma factor FlgM [Eubacterium sp.]